MVWSIKDILDRPNFDLLDALPAHKVTLQKKAERLNRLISTVNYTILHLKGELEMSPQNFFEGLGEEKQQEYEQEIRRRYGEASVKEPADRWGRYTPEQKEKIKTTCPSFCTRSYSFTAEPNGQHRERCKIRTVKASFGSNRELTIGWPVPTFELPVSSFYRQGSHIAKTGHDVLQRPV